VAVDRGEMTVSVAVIWLFFSSTSLADRPVVLNGTAVAPVSTLNPALVTSGQSLYAQNCAGCHGANLQGVPDWKKPLPDGSFPPPPQDSSGHTWHHPDALILSIIANGGDPAYNSKMPAFKDKLTSDEMAAILDYIKSKWGKNEREFQWWISATGNRP
jgi:mono/diheme cytochrome c family protein